MTSITISPAQGMPAASGDTCPAWCARAGGHCDGEHRSLEEEITLSHGTPYSTGSGTYPGHVAVCTCTGPQLAAAAVGLRHADHYVPDMTPAEALALAAALARAAFAARSEKAAAPGGCPAWCDIADHETEDGGAMLHNLSESHGLEAYPYDVMGERYHEPLFAIRRQAHDGQPAIVVEHPADGASDPGGLLDTPARQAMLTTGEAVELAVSLLHLAIDPEGLLLDAGAA